MIDKNISTTSSEFSKFFTTYFPKEKYPAGFSGRKLKFAGRKFKFLGEEETIKYLVEEYNPNYVKADHPFPAYANIVACSRPISEWDYTQINRKIQNIIFSARKDTDLNLGSSKAAHLEWFKKTGLIESSVDELSYYNTQGINLIIQNARNIREGVLTKAENKYKKDLERAIQKGVEEPQKPPIFNDDGYLISPPGFNPTVYGYQSCNLRPIDLVRDKNILRQIGLANYERNPSDIINVQYKFTDRLKLSPGQIGSIPDHQKDKIQASSKRRLLSKRENNNPILYIVKFGKDWCIFDGRGFLRHIYWRKLAKPGTLTINSLLDFLTADVVINPVREHNQVSLSFDPDRINQQTKEPIGFRKAPELIGKMLEKQNVIGISFDLGQTNILSYQVFNIPARSSLSQVEKHLSNYKVRSGILKPEEINSLQKLRNKLDWINEQIYQEAILSFPAEIQEQIKRTKLINSEETKNKIVEKFGLDTGKIEWEKINQHSKFISTYLQNIGKENEIYFSTIDRKTKKEKQCIKTDRKFANEFKIKLPDEIRKQLNDKIWEIQKTSKEYKKHTIWKIELVRSIINKLVKLIKDEFDLEPLLLIEDLNKKDNFFSGSGKRVDGWGNLFLPKKENRWLINIFHKTLLELGANKGKTIIKFHPANTSITCPTCREVHKENRDGENFKCIKCGYVGNADIDVAPFNGMRVALTGKGLSTAKKTTPPQAGCERSSGGKIDWTARKAQILGITEHLEEVRVNKM